MKPLISIIVPVFNAKDYLVNCINSIVNQTVTNFELLLVDDGSTDGSGELCDEFATSDDRISVFHKENGGNSSARNLGIEYAKGEWLYFVDSDDELFPNALTVLSDCIIEDVDMVLAGYVVVDNTGKEVYSVNQRTKVLISNERAIELMFNSSPYRYLGYIWIKLFRASTIKNSFCLFADDIFYNEDRLFSIWFLCESKKSVVYTTTPVYRYYERPNGLMCSINKGFNPKFLTDIEASKRMVQLIKDAYPNSEAVYNLSKYGLYHSYVAIINRINRFGSTDPSIKKKVKSILFRELSYFDYIRYEVKRYYFRIRKWINQLFLP